jgi:hypothetical protein
VRDTRFGTAYFFVRVDDVLLVSVSSSGFGSLSLPDVADADVAVGAESAAIAVPA